MFLLPTLFMIYFTGICGRVPCFPFVCEKNPVYVCGEGHRLVHGPRAKIITCQSNDECHVSVNIDISADHFLHCLNSSLCIVDFDRIKNYISEDTTGKDFTNSSCSMRQVNTIGLQLLDCSCLPDKGSLFFDINNSTISQKVNSEFLFGYNLGSGTINALKSYSSGINNYICNVMASSGSFSKVAVVNSFIGNEEVKIKNEEVDCVSLSRNTFYSYREIDSTNGALTLEISLRNTLQETEAFQILLWIKVTPNTTVSMNCDVKVKESKRSKRSACTRLNVDASLFTPTSETNPGYPIRTVVISVVAGVVLIVVVTSIASAVIYTRRYKRKLEEPQYDTMGSHVSSSHYTIPNSFMEEQETLPRPTQTTAYLNSAQENQISRTEDGLRKPITPNLPPPRTRQIKKSPAIATVSDGSAGYSHAFDHLPGLQGHFQRPNPNMRGSRKFFQGESDGYLNLLGGSEAYFW